MHNTDCTNVLAHCIIFITFASASEECVTPKFIFASFPAKPSPWSVLECDSVVYWTKLRVIIGLRVHFDSHDVSIEGELQTETITIK